ncbi:MAG: SCP2 sterol-binding domain-containing protein [Egibacteraceae bacterium]
MPVFPSGEWMQALCAQLVAQPEAGRLADVLAGRYRLVVQPAGALVDQHVYEVTIAPSANGTPRVTWSGGDGAAATLEFSADYERWQQLISGTLDIPLAIVLGRLRVRGDLARITGNAGYARPLLDALRAVDTQWLP